MPSASPPTEQFWLLTGEVPSGPFNVAQVHAELAAGRATWQTPACPVGGSTWLPLVQTPGIGPSAPPRTAAATRSPDAHPASASVASAPPVNEPAPVGSLEGVFAAKSPASGSRSTPAPDAAPSTPPHAPTGARQKDQPPACAEPPQPNEPSEPNPPKSAGGSNAGAGSSTPSPTPSAPGRTSLLQMVGLHPQVVQVGIGVLLMAAFLGLAQSCKEDAKNQPSLPDRLKEQRNKNPLPPVPPPKTGARPE